MMGLCQHRALVGMTGHLVFTAWDAENPATLSETVIRDVIRGQIGFDGLLLTDDIDMEALGGSIPERAARAYAAGCDIILNCWAKMDDMQGICDVLPAMSEATAARSASAEPRSHPDPRRRPRGSHHERGAHPDPRPRPRGRISMPRPSIRRSGTRPPARGGAGALADHLEHDRRYLPVPQGREADADDAVPLAHAVVEMPPGEIGQLKLMMKKIDEKRDELRQKRRDIDETLSELDQAEEACLTRLVEIGVGT